MGLPIGHILDSDTLALWRADEASDSTLEDATGNYPLAASGAYDIVAGQVGNAREVAASGAFASAVIPDATIAIFNGSFTIEALVKIDPTNLGNGLGTVVSISGAGEAFGIGVDHDGAVGAFETRFGSFAGAGTPSGAFCHIAVRCTVGAGDMVAELFLNGSKFLSAADVGTLLFTSGGSISLGQDPSGNGLPFTSGTIDEVRISRIARTDAEILESYQRCFGLYYPAVGLTHETDHADVAVSRLLQQYQGKPLREGLIRALCTEVQALEDAAFDVGVFRVLAVAIGAQLDGIGEIVGEDRSGRNDDDYRAAIQARMLLNRSSGTIPELVVIFSALLPNNAVTVQEWFPAALTLRSEGPVTNADLLASILQEAKDGGVRAIFEYLATDAADTFTLGDSSAQTTSSTQGLSDTSNPTSGGQLAGAIE